MLNLNRATILGNCTRDPEMRYTPSGQPVATFAVATNRVWTDSSGSRQEDVEFHEIVAWSKLAEICTQVLAKGRKVYVEGRLKTRNWESQDGVKHYKTEVIAENVIALDRPRETAAPYEEAPLPEEAKTAAAQTSEVIENVSAETPSVVQETDAVEAPALEPTGKKAKGKKEEETVNIEDLPF